MATLQTLGPFHNAPEVRLLPSTGITRLPRYYGPVRLPRRPGLSLAGVRLVLQPPLGVSRVATVLPVPACRRHYPGGTTGEGESFPEEPVTAAFPIPLLGRLPHFPFRGLLSVHSRYGLLARGIAKRSFPSEASAVKLPRLPLRLLPAGTTVAGQELHLLKNDAFSRRTKGWEARRPFMLPAPLPLWGILFM